MVYVRSATGVALGRLPRTAPFACYGAAVVLLRFGACIPFLHHSSRNRVHFIRLVSGSRNILALRSRVILLRPSRSATFFLRYARLCCLVQACWSSAQGFL